MVQIPLSFPPINNSFIDLIRGIHNEEVIKFLFDKFLSSKERIILIYGNSKVGKSYITNIFINKVNGRILTFKDISNLLQAEVLANTNKVFLIEDVNNLTLVQEKLLFHFYNLIIASNTSYLILTSNVSPKEIQYSLPDLYSRILGIRSLHILEPQDDAIKQLVFKMFQDKQLNVDMSIINYILMRVERKSLIIYNLIKKIENEIFITKKKLTINLVKTVIEKC